jgi:glycosyltransferase involved in cell wall biosynthesis
LAHRFRFFKDEDVLHLHARPGLLGAMSGDTRVRAKMKSFLRIGIVGPVATTIPAAKNGSVELVTALLCDGLVERGHAVSLFGVAKTQTRAVLHATFERGYSDLHGLWPWEMCELVNVAIACERWQEFDVIHYQAPYFPVTIAFSKIISVPFVQTIHHQPMPGELALLRKYPETHYVAISDYQAGAMTGLNSVTTVRHGIDTRNFRFGIEPDDYLVFLGRFTPGKGALAAIEVARRTGTRLLMAAPESDYYRTNIASQVDGHLVRYLGELDFPKKTQLLSHARALIYPVQEGEPFGLVLVEAMACGTPIAALKRGAVPELVKEGVSGYSFDSLDDLIAGLPRVYGLDRAAVRAHAVRHFDEKRMVDEYERLYRRVCDR